MSMFDACPGRTIRIGAPPCSMITVRLRRNSIQPEIYRLAAPQYAAAQLVRGLAQLAHFFSLS
jgi:hypothetical protein